jgi:Trp operon repressor
MYMVVAKATYKVDNEIFKKHFAKSMGLDMIEEKVNAVKIMMAKLVSKVPKGYSKSVDKISEMLAKTCKSGEVKQYLPLLNKQKENEFLGQRRFISTECLTATLKQDEIQESLISINTQTASKANLSLPASEPSTPLGNEEGEAKELAEI